MLFIEMSYLCTFGGYFVGGGGWGSNLRCVVL